MNPTIIKALVTKLKNRTGLILLEKVKGHAEIEENESANRLANEKTRKPVLDQLDLQISDSYVLLGKKLTIII